MSDVCKYVNNAYTDANPYIAHAVIQNSNPTTVASFQATYPNGREGISPQQAAFIYVVDSIRILIDTLPFGLDENVAGAGQTNSTVIDVCGNRVSYIWVIYMVLAGPATAPVGVSEAIRQRRWICGFEIPNGEVIGGGGALAGNGVYRDASRVPGGLGMRIRSNEAQFVEQSTTIYGGVAPKSSWERVYLHPWTYDNVGITFWRAYGSTSPLGSGALALLSNGMIRIDEIDSGGVLSVLLNTGVVVPLNRWSRLDIIVTFGNGGATSGRMRVWLNGTLIGDVQSANGTGLGQNGNHLTTDLGTRLTTHTLELDVDDWINADVPVLFNGLDWLSGSHVRRVGPRGDGAGRVGWTGDWRIGLQLPTVTSGQQITSTTANARLELVGEADALEPLGEFQLGVVAMVIGGYVGMAGGGNGQLGFSINAIDDLQATTIPVSNAWRAVAHRPSGLTTPLTLSPYRLLLIRDAGVVEVRCVALQATVECLGSWGVEDQATTTVPIPDSGIHNGPYWEHSQYRGSPGAPPFGEVIVESGVYTGNGTGQDVPKSGPIHFLFLRRVTGGSSIVSWHAGMISPHTGISGTAGLDSENMVQALVEASGAAVTRVAGNNADSNNSADTYQWIAVSDPAMRYLLTGAFGHTNPQTAAATNPLIDTTFFPEASFFFQESIQVGGGASMHWYKGVGHAGAVAQRVDLTETAGVVTFGLGNLLSQTPLHTGQHSVAFAAFRQQDGGGPPGSPNCDPANTGRPAGLTTYIGNGAGGNRVIPVSLGGRRPLFAIVQPHNSFARFRDPSHTGTQTGNLSSGALTGSTTEIVDGGVDFITVGTTLNTLNIVYDVFVLAGDLGGVGWGTNGVFYPVPPATPCGDVWGLNPSPPSPPPGPGAACSTGDFPTELT